MVVPSVSVMGASTRVGAMLEVLGLAGKLSGGGGLLALFSDADMVSMGMVRRRECPVKIDNKTRVAQAAEQRLTAHASLDLV
jgi:hypothetical protein